MKNKEIFFASGGNWPERLGVTFSFPRSSGSVGSSSGRASSVQRTSTISLNEGAPVPTGISNGMRYAPALPLLSSTTAASRTYWPGGATK